MPTRAKALKTSEIAAIEDLMSDLEKRLRRLSEASRSETAGATNDVHDFVNEALGNIMKSVRNGATDITGQLADEATRYTNDTMKKLTHEVEQRPLIMLGVAVGIGFLVGLANRR